MQRKQKGFTLLEILLVISAIGILAAIVLVAINPTRQLNQARTAAINSERNAIAKALQQELIDTGNYPAGLDGVQRRLCSSTVITDCITIAGDLVPNYIAAIPTGATYTAAIGTNGRIYINPTETVANLTCPTGYIRVPGNSLYNTKDFCVMKYEAKAVSINDMSTGLSSPLTAFNTVNNVATPAIPANNRTIASVPNGRPLSNIGVTIASSYCSNLGTGYTIMSNTHYMTIARNIEAQNTNWTGGLVGQGGIYRGFTGGFNTALEAGPDSDPYYATGFASNDFRKRTHILSNGEVIWDISGNVWETLPDTVPHNQHPTSASIGWGWKDIAAMDQHGILGYDGYKPGNPNWGVGQYMGRALTDGNPFSTGVSGMARGSGSSENDIAGIYSMTLWGNYDPLAVGGDIGSGFRCIYQ